MSTTAKANGNTADTGTTTAAISEAEDMKMFQAARRNGRRNALGDLSEQLAQVNTSNSSSDVDKMAPHFQSMSIKH